MLEAVPTDLVFTISLKRSTQNLQLSTSSPADYPISSSDRYRIAALRQVTFRAISRLLRGSKLQSYSITSSAVASKDGGIFRLSAAAV
jgi:hypothetical protein